MCGTIATIFAVEAEFTTAAFFVVLGIVFDFFDGFAARLLNVTGELGKQLDSLADMVTSGVVPGVIMFQLLKNSSLDLGTYIPYFGLLITLAACYRLAKFNLDTRQTDSFIGLPTPAMSLFVIALPLIIEYSDYTFVIDLIRNSYFLLGTTIVLSFLMHAEIPLFSLKFKSYGFKENTLQYLFLLISLILLSLLQFVAVPLIIISYVLISLIGRMNSS